MSRLPSVAIVGRPNVGKSSFFNRMVGKTLAIIAQEPGTTRNKLESKITPKKGMPFQLIDTAGVMALDVDDEKVAELENRVQDQVKFAAQHADVLLVMLDGQEEGLLSTDYEVAEMVRRLKKPYVLVVNKCDNKRIADQAVHIYELGLDEPVFISVSHKQGLDVVLQKLQDTFVDLGYSKEKEAQEEDHHRAHARLALVGTPNVGKSSLFNALTGRDDVLVSDVAGTTRDIADTTLIHDDKEYVLIDTAGMRKRGKIERGIETFSIMRTKDAIYRSDVCILVLDATKGITKQDQHVAEAVLHDKKGLIIVVNKWDKIQSRTDFPVELQAARIHVTDLMDQYVAYLRFKFPFLSWAPAVFTSSITGKNINRILPIVDGIIEERSKRIETGILNRYIERIIEKHKPTGAKAYIPRISYVTQLGVRPPHFVLVVNDKKFFHFSYVRYVENKLREKFGFEGTAMIVELKNKKKKDYSGRN